jgi:RNA recognition motif-containing protein
MDKNTGHGKGFGFVEMTNDTEGQAAIGALNGVEVAGKAWIVNVAKSRESDTAPKALSENGATRL